MDGNNEDYDSFDINNDAFHFDGLAHVDATGQSFLPPRNNRFSGERSAATTQLATDVGSTVLRARVPFLKSITFFDPKIYYREVKSGTSNDDVDGVSPNGDSSSNRSDGASVTSNDLPQWDIKLKDPPKDETNGGLLHRISRSKIGAKLRLSKSPRLVVQDFEGIVELSSIQSGDLLLSINKKRMMPNETSAEEARRFMDECIESTGVLNVVTENFSGDGESMF
jgi:hypothetical protein